jgi:hypothetical protein
VERDARAASWANIETLLRETSLLYDVCTRMLQRQGELIERIDSGMSRVEERIAQAHAALLRAHTPLDERELALLAGTAAPAPQAPLPSWLHWLRRLFGATP